MDVKTAVGIWTGNVSCIPKLCSDPPSIANTLHTSVERYYLEFVAYNCKSGYSLNRLRYGKKEFLLGCKFDGTYDLPHLTCQPINCTFEDALVAKTIDLSGRFLPSSSPVVLGPGEWLKYQCGEGHTLSGIPDSSDLFTTTCLDGDHTVTHCKSVQCGVPPVIAHATPVGSCFVTITYGEQVEYQCEADYHVEPERKSGSKPEGCHATKRTESEQPVQATEEPVGACRVVDTTLRLKRNLPHGSVSRIGLSRPTNGWRTGAAPGATKCLSGQFLSRTLQARRILLACVSLPDMTVEPS